MDLPGRHPGLHQLLGLFSVPPVRVFQRWAGDSTDGGGVGCGACGDGLRGLGNGLLNGVLNVVNGLLMGYDIHV